MSFMSVLVSMLLQAMTINPELYKPHVLEKKYPELARLREEYEQAIEKYSAWEYLIRKYENDDI